MVTVNMHEAKTQLSRLVAKAAAGEPFVIAKAGKPLVKVVALDAPDFWRGRLKCQTISTGCSRTRSRRCFMAMTNEIPAGHACDAVVCGELEAAFREDHEIASRR